MYKRPTYTIQGMNFQLKPTTPDNIDLMRNHFNPENEEVATMDDYDQFLELLRVITEPVTDKDDFDKINVRQLDIKQVEHILGNFLPNLMAISLGLKN